MRPLQRIKILYFELAYSIICENKAIDLLEAISTILDFFQIAALIFSPRFKNWDAGLIQDGLHFALLNFNSLIFSYVAISGIVLMDVMFIFLIWQIAYKGGITTFRILMLTRVLVGIMSSFLFLPLMEEAVQYLYTYLVNNDAALTDVLVICITTLIGLTIPSFLVAYVQGPDLQNLNTWTRVSSRQQVFILITKVILSVTYSIYIDDLFPFILLIVLIAILVMAIKNPPYFSPMINLLWFAQHCTLTYCCLVFVVMEAYNPATPNISWFYAALGGTAPAWMFGAFLFKYYKFNKLLYGMRVWEYTLSSIYHRFIAMFDWRTNTSGSSIHISCVPLVESTTAVPAALLIERCSSPNHIIFVANTLFATAGIHLKEYLSLFLTLGARRYPESESIYLCWISILAVMGDVNVHQKGFIQNLIRKANSRTAPRTDTRFQYYSIVKNFEITEFRQQGREMKKMPVLDIIRYHYNYTEATKNYVETIKWSYQFWRACAANGTRNVDTNTRNLEYIADQLQEHQTDALHHYHVLLERYPSSSTILRSYAEFAMDVLNNPRLCEDILEFADRLDEERADHQLYDRRRKSVANTSDLGAQDQQQEDTKSERSGSRISGNTGRSSDMLKNMSKYSIFDTESFEDGRNAVAMRSVTSLKSTIMWSLAVLFVSVIVQYVLAQSYSGGEARIRQLVLDSGIVRRDIVGAVFDIQSLGLSLHKNSTNITDIALKQASVQTSSLAILRGLDTLYYKSGASMTDSLISYWTSWRDIPDRTFTTMQGFLAPIEAFNLLALNGLETSTLPPEQLSHNSASLKWTLDNCFSNQFYAHILNIVQQFVEMYQQQVQYWMSSLTYSSYAVAVLPIVLFLVFFLPKWFRLKQDLDAATQIFTKIPRQVANQLSIEMKELYDSKKEAIGQDNTPLGQGAQSIGRDNLPVVPVGRRKKNRLAYHVLLASLISLVIVQALQLAMSYSVSKPIQLLEKRGPLINYSGLRFSTTFRLATGLRELQQVQRSVPRTERESKLLVNRKEYWKSSIRDAAVYLNTIHDGILYGNSSLGLIRTIGINTKADTLTFTPNCNQSENPSCLSFHDTISHITTLVNHAINSEIVLDEVVEELIRLSQVSTGPILSKILPVRLAYSETSQFEISVLQTVSAWLLGFTPPLYLSLFVLLIHVFSLVRSRIKRTRGILFQLPEEIQAAIPSISHYLKTGHLMIENDDLNSAPILLQEASLPKGNSSFIKQEQFSKSNAVILERGNGSQANKTNNQAGPSASPNHRKVVSFCSLTNVNEQEEVKEKELSAKLTADLTGFPYIRAFSHQGSLGRNHQGSLGRTSPIKERLLTSGGGETMSADAVELKGRHGLLFCAHEEPIKTLPKNLSFLTDHKSPTSSLKSGGGRSESSFSDHGFNSISRPGADDMHLFHERMLDFVNSVKAGAPDIEEAVEVDEDVTGTTYQIRNKGSSD